MSSSSGIRYVPRNKRRGKRPERLHGAFTGGFSAGHFNTVDTAEGWKPQQQQQQQEPGAGVTDEAQPQTLDDFMDEQDHNEWGGPTRVRQDLVGRALATQPTALQSATSLKESVFGSTTKESLSAATALQPSANVASRLLRHMGWREGSTTAYVPDHEHGVTSKVKTNNNSDKQQQEHQQFSTHAYLSKRRLRKIRVQQAQIQIPRPKMDQTGLGFDAHVNAPEFQAFRAKQRRLAAARAQGKKRGRSVYRVSNLVVGKGKNDEEEEDDEAMERDKDDDNHNHYESYEVMEDFVGTRTVGGFALHDDEDDAFDDHDDKKQLTKISDKILLDKEEYNTVIEDPHSDDDDDNVDIAARRNKKVQADELAKGLLAWTDTSTGITSASGGDSAIMGAGLMTSDGRPPLPGFVLGPSGSGSMVQRFRGPDLPDDYQLNPHVFREEEHPMVWKTLARAVQLETDQARKQAAIKDALASNRIAQKVPRKKLQPDGPLAGNAFSSLANAMKNRFTTGKGDKNDSGEEKTALPAGLVSASELPIKPKEGVESATMSSSKQETRHVSTLTRTVQSFAPAPLLCKRFGVRAPMLNSTAVVPTESQPTGTPEETYFRNEILTAAQQARSVRSAASSNPSNTESDDKDTTEPRDPFAGRPAMDVYKSIFGVQEEDSQSDDDESNVGENDQDEGKQNPKEPTTETANKGVESTNAPNDVEKQSATPGHYEAPQDFNTWTSDSSMEQNSEDSYKKSAKDRKRRKKDEKKMKKKKKRRKRDYSDDNDSESLSVERKHRRKKHRRKEERRKKEKSKERRETDENHEH